MTERDDQLLDLSDLAPERQQVRLEKDGPLYDMRSPSEMGFDQRAKMIQLVERVDRLQGGGKKQAEKQIAELEKTLREVARLALPDAPAPAIRKLHPHQLDVLTARFLIAFGDMISQVAKAMGSERVAAMVESQTSAS